MKNLWQDGDVGGQDALAECVYGSRLIGCDHDLVLHGGGNTSVKADFVDITGEVVPALYVKGSGWDLATIEAPGFTPLPLDRLLALLQLDTLADTDMMRELAGAKLNPDAPAPSVETLLHAFLPFPAIQHSHADVIVALTNVADGEGQIRDVFGPDVVIIPYVMPGFDLAKVVAEEWPKQATESTTGMVLLNHGLFTFGATTRDAYGRHVELISRAEQFLAERAPEMLTTGAGLMSPAALVLAELRSQISELAGAPMIMSTHTDDAVAAFVERPDLASLANRGPLTPDHVIRTKRVPMIGRDVEKFGRDYTSYYERNEHRGRTELTMLDPAPRVVVDPELGLLTLGRTVKAADIAADIYRHTMPVLARSEDHLGGYVALDEGHLFDCEYWDLEQAKLRRAGDPPELAGTVAVVTGAASGIGRACASALMGRGAAVAGFDLAEDVGEAFDGPAWLGKSVDVSNAEAQVQALEAAVTRFGGVDIVVVAAGVFGESTPLANHDPEQWRQVQSVNVDAVAALFGAVHPFLACSPVGGRVVVIGSKNFPAPGPGAAAYSASKAALTQLARVAALEWAPDGIRVNTVHPDAVFDTGLWTEELLAERAAKYEMTVEEYKRRNLLSTEVTSAKVAGVVAELASDSFSATTGAQIPIDGGNERVV